VQLCALASRWEGFPISILEAMRAGLPVAASNAGGVAEAVQHGVTGFLVPCGDAAALRACLELLLRDPALRKRLGDAGRRRYEAGFTLDRMARRTFDAYQKVLREAREAGRLPSPSGCSPSVHP
jgi:glycosyltransferase involved in cell wall biosynthesis